MYTTRRNGFAERDSLSHALNTTLVDMLFVSILMIANAEAAAWWMMIDFGVFCCCCFSYLNNSDGFSAEVLLICLIRFGLLSWRDLVVMEGQFGLALTNRLEITGPMRGA